MFRLVKATNCDAKKMLASNPKMTSILEEVREQATSKLVASIFCCGAAVDAPVVLS